MRSPIWESQEICHCILRSKLRTAKCITDNKTQTIMIMYSMCVLYNARLPYFGKRKQVTYHLNLSYGCFHIFTQCALLPGQILLCINTHLAKRYVREDTMIFHWRQWKWQTHLLFHKKFHFCHLLLFAKIGQMYVHVRRVDSTGSWYNNPSRRCISQF